MQGKLTSQAKAEEQHTLKVNHSQFFLLGPDYKQRGFFSYRGEKAAGGFDAYESRTKEPRKWNDHPIFPTLISVEYRLLDDARTDATDFSVPEDRTVIQPLYLGPKHTIILEIIAASASEIKFVNRTHQEIARFE
ncbi:hypothetical protein HYU07_05740 [Candidatus Woesearchaeota archaeon]|nr:hypothetical protein [Candidatus Woesearchaeota archaeon]